MLIPVHVNGHPAIFLLDTGIEISFLHAQRAREFGVAHVGRRTESGGRSFPIGAADNLSAGSSSLGRVEVALFDPAQFHGPLPGKGGKAADGILGLDLLRRFGAVINCRTQQMFLRSETTRGLDLTATTSALGFDRIPLSTTTRGFVSVPCSIANRPGSLYIDTGSYITIFDRGNARALQLQETPSTLRARTAGGREATLNLARVENFRIGGIAIEPQRFAVMDLFPDRKPLRVYTPGLVTRFEYYDARAMKARRDIWGLLGSELLYQHSAIIDLANMVLYLK